MHTAGGPCQQLRSYTAPLAKSLRHVCHQRSSFYRAVSHQKQRLRATPSPARRQQRCYSRKADEVATDGSQQLKAIGEVAAGGAQQLKAMLPAGRTALGEDAAAFDRAQQTTGAWTIFTVLLLGVLGLLYVAWIDPDTGLANGFLHSLERVSSNSETVMTLILAVFAATHSGLAYLRPYGEELIGPRAFRVIFALVSLPLALLALVFFINHRYDGAALWNLRRAPGAHELCWVMNFVSFFFLYPSTFNILEVAAVDEPKVHLWETGVIRITRHPQSFGQAIWCAAHMLWIGSSFMAVTSAALMAHHAFSCWHGDFRLKRKYGDDFEEVKARTSILPFAAIVQGRQQLPQDYYKEFLRLPYLTVLALTLGAYWAHPLMQSASAWLGW